MSICQKGVNLLSITVYYQAVKLSAMADWFNLDKATIAERGELSFPLSSIVWFHDRRKQLCNLPSATDCLKMQYKLKSVLNPGLSPLISIAILNTVLISIYWESLLYDVSIKYLQLDM